ncbi:hypothetical protein AN964_06545 [Heyndrickxia shackletonii]|uniref:Uncharacterized protein n=1 Tax=Heyndrickxia shackletonii TaxID=157838 RepID=A0A0Q3TGN9_9BACI|nr:hypothetical protein AN964_06545 [Heyndrickxia shackletonii]
MLQNSKQIIFQVKSLSIFSAYQLADSVSSLRVKHQVKMEVLYSLDKISNFTRRNGNAIFTHPYADGQVLTLFY